MCGCVCACVLGVCAMRGSRPKGGGGIGTPAAGSLVERTHTILSTILSVILLFHWFILFYCVVLFNLLIFNLL